MKVNPKSWTKNQKITGIVLLSVLVLGGAGTGVAVHNNNVHNQRIAASKAAETKKINAEKAAKAKAEQLAKDKEAAAEKGVASLLSTANQNPSDASVKAVNDAIAKLTDEATKTKDLTTLKAIEARLTLIKKAQAAVKDYQAHATNASKQKAAQTAINALTNKNDADVKAALQKLYDAANKQAQAAAKAAQTKAATINSSASSTPAANPTNANNTSNNTSSTASNSNYNSGSSGTTSNTGGSSNTNNGSGSTASTPSTPAAPSQPATPPSSSTPVTHVYQGWVKNGAGTIVATQNFDTANAAGAWAQNYANTHFNELFVNGKPGSVGWTQLS